MSGMSTERIRVSFHNRIRDSSRMDNALALHYRSNYALLLLTLSSCSKLCRF